jgi:hypothetical protein
MKGSFYAAAILIFLLLQELTSTEGAHFLEGLITVRHIERH